MLCIIKKDSLKIKIPITYTIAKKRKKPKMISVISNFFDPLPTRRTPTVWYDGRILYIM
jgi:hypothetical protein